MLLEPAEDGDGDGDPEKVVLENPLVLHVVREGELRDLGGEGVRVLHGAAAHLAFFGRLLESLCQCLEGVELGAVGWGREARSGVSRRNGIESLE